MTNQIFLDLYQDSTTLDKDALKQAFRQRQAIAFTQKQLQQEDAAHYYVSPKLKTAINLALATARPLLLMGEPGTGKTKLATHLQAYFQAKLVRLDVKSTTTQEDLTYRFDAVAYLHTANDPRYEKVEIDKGDERFIIKGKLWEVLEADEPCILLIDEIDKAPRDFPNDLLRELDQFSFECKEQRRTIEKKHSDLPHPLVIISSNNERRLPDAFLRRCIFHYIQLEDILEQAIAAHRGSGVFLDDASLRVAVQRFTELRQLNLHKAPGLAELLLWLSMLSMRDGSETEDLAELPLAELPYLGLLIKTPEDLEGL